MRLMEAAILFTDTSGRINTPQSRRSFLKVIQHLDKWAGGEAGVEVDQLTAHDLTEWCLSERTRDGGPSAPSTIRNRRANVRSFYSWAAWKGLVETNPAAELDWTVQPGRGSVSSHTWLDEKTALALINHRADTPAGQRDQLIVILGMMTGLRAGVEIAGLRWDQIDEDMTSITVVGKGNKRATVGIPGQLRTALREWEALKPEGAEYVLPRFRKVWNPKGHCVEDQIDWGQPLGYDGILNAVRQTGKRLGVVLRPHDLRRSFASILEAQGVPLNDISLAMRHENVATTSRYLDRNPAKATAVTSDFKIGAG